MIGLKGLPAKGGAATVGQNIIAELKSEIDYTVLSVASHTNLKSGNNDGIIQIVFPSFGKGGLNTYIYYWRCAIYCLFHKFDLVHLHHAESGFIIRLLKLRSKVLVTFHGVFLKEDPKFSGFQNKFFRFSERLNVKYADAVVSVSAPDCEFISKKYGRTIDYIPNNIKLYPNGFGERKIKEPYLFFAAGRIYEIKGLHLLLKAAHQCKLKIKIVVAGDLEQVPGYREEILKLAQGLDIEFLNLINDKLNLLNYAAFAECFVFPSLTEAMSIMLLEAVSTKVPVIASDIPANLSIFSKEELLYFKSNHVNDLAEKINFAFKNKKQMQAMADRAYGRLIENYTGEIVGAKYHKLCEALMQ